MPWPPQVVEKVKRRTSCWSGSGSTAWRLAPTPPLHLATALRVYKAQGVTRTSSASSGRGEAPGDLGRWPSGLPGEAVDAGERVGDRLLVLHEAATLAPRCELRRIGAGGDEAGRLVEPL